MFTLQIDLVPGQAYSFRYPNFEDSTDLRRLIVHDISGQYVTGLDLDNGRDGKWSLDRMQRVEPTQALVIPGRVYRCKWARRRVSVLVYSCYPTSDGFRVTGRSGGEFVAMDLSELSGIEVVG